MVAPNQRHIGPLNGNAGRVGSAPELEAPLLLAQGLYYVASGMWPLVSMRTFESVTGPKTDDWLVKTVGVLVSVIGGVMVAGASRRQDQPDVRALAMASAAALTLVDAVYVAKRRISPIYLLDALLESAFILGWFRVPRAVSPLHHG